MKPSAKKGASRITALPLLLLLPGLGCSIWDPFLAERPQHEDGMEDAAEAHPDLGGDCAEAPDNLIMNPSFETPAGGAGEGRADNTGEPSSTIPGPFSGCCSQSDGGTVWVVFRGTRRCGARSLQVQSTRAATNYLSQDLTDQSVNFGRPFELSGSVLVTQVGGGGYLVLEVWEGAGRSQLATTAEVGAPTDGWLRLSQRGTVPRTGRLQLRIRSSGDVQAYVDDLLLRIP
jgi:hypothetical protein